jgi:hypothetical protein
MSTEEMDAPTRLAHEIRAALLGREDTTVAEIEDQPLTEQPDYHDVFSLSTQVQAFGPNVSNAMLLSGDVAYLILTLIHELRKRHITPALTMPAYFEGSKPFVFFHCLGYVLAISVDCPAVADVTTEATLTISVNVDSDSL